MFTCRNCNWCKYVNVAWNCKVHGPENGNHETDSVWYNCTVCLSLCERCLIHSPAWPGHWLVVNEFCIFRRMQVYCLRLAFSSILAVKVSFGDIRVLPSPEQMQSLRNATTTSPLWCGDENWVCSCNECMLDISKISTTFWLSNLFGSSRFHRIVPKISLHSLFQERNLPRRKS